MEVWALEPYGAAHTLQEMLTVQIGRCQWPREDYESIVKGERIENRASRFVRVLAEMQSMGSGRGRRSGHRRGAALGKDEEKQKMPRLSMACSAPGRRRRLAVADERQSD